MLTLFGLAFLSLLPTYLTKKENVDEAEDKEDPKDKSTTVQPEKKSH